MTRSRAAPTPLTATAIRVTTAAPRDPVLRYAAKELRRLWRRAIPPGPGPVDRLTIHLSAGTADDDGFQVRRGGTGLHIHGANPRSLLFGVFAFLERFANCRWFHPGEEIVTAQGPPQLDLTDAWEETPTIGRRYIFPEGMVFSRSWLRRLIDWAPRNMIGDITLSFDAWESWHQQLLPDLVKRGLSVTLSGHCLKMFVPPETATEHPEWFAQTDDDGARGGQYCFSSRSLQRCLAERLGDFLGRTAPVRRLSIWAEDAAIQCQCSACRQQGFLASLNACIQAIGDQLRQRYPDLEVNFLAYNAGLAWNMLEPGPEDGDTDALEIAYWGRDYRYALATSRQAADRRAERCIQNWRQTTRRDLAILEYYTDIWMLTHQIPALPRRIASDCRAYKRLGIDALGVLICLARPELGPMRGNMDRFAPLTYPNLYFFAACSWDARQSPDTLCDDYARYRFGADAPLCLAYLQELEKSLAVLSSFNQSLFRLRFVDLWARDETPAEGGIKFVPCPWSPDHDWDAEERRRNRVCGQLVRRFKAFEAEHGWDLAETDESCRSRASVLREVWQGYRQRFEAMHIQLQAQAALRRDQTAAALRHLQRALSLDTGLHPSERRHCQHWLRRLM